MPTTESARRPRSTGRSGPTTVIKRTASRPASSTLRNATAALGALVLLAVVALGVQRLLDPGLGGPPRCTVTSSAGASFDLTPEQARNAATVAAVATRRGLPPYAATIGIATAMQESRLRNLAGGDRDSVGLFQQRPSQGWGTVAQIRNPVYATGKFYDGLVTVPGWQTLPLTEAAQQVQRSAAPHAYAQHETEAATFAEALSGVRPESIGCRLKDASPGPSAEQIRGTLLTETGLAADVIDGALVLRAEARRDAATVAGWAVAAADDLGVREVWLGSKVWRRSTATEALSWADSGEKQADTAVRIGLLHR